MSPARVADPATIAGTILETAKLHDIDPADYHAAQCDLRIAARQASLSGRLRDVSDDEDVSSISLTRPIEPRVAVYFDAAAAPSIDDLGATIHAWIDRRVTAPLASKLHHLIDSPHCAITASELDRAVVPQIVDATRGQTNIGKLELARLRAASKVVLVHTIGLPGGLWVPLWTAIAAGRALVERFDGVARDLGPEWLLPCGTCTAAISASGKLSISEHVRVVVRPSGDAADVVTVGALRLGVPNLIMQRVPFDSDLPLFKRALVDIVAQHVSELWHGMRDEPRPERLRLSNAIDLGFGFDVMGDDVSLLLVTHKRDRDGEPILLDVITPPPVDWSRWVERAKSAWKHESSK